MREMITFCLLMFALQAIAQRAYISANAEYTVTGLQYGLSLGYLSKSSFQAGIFYQQGTKKSDTWPSFTSTFYGVEGIVPLVRSNKIMVGGHLRAGLANQQFVVIVPSFLTLVNVYKDIQVGLTMGWRYGNPAIGARLQFKL